MSLSDFFTDEPNIQQDEKEMWIKLHYKIGLNLDKLHIFSKILKSNKIEKIDDLNNLSFKVGSENYYIIEEIKKILTSKLPEKEEKLILEIKKKFKVLPIIDKGYPASLKEIPNPPIVLIVNGKIPDLTRSVGVVGSRASSSFSLLYAAKIGEFFGNLQYTVISGLAYGIDTQSHIGCLGSNGKALAVMGTPVNEVYPKENIHIYNEIIKSGAVVSDVLARNQLTNRAFYVRNRIISGLSKVIIVVESKESGGTIQQMKYAQEQNKPILMLIPPEEHNYKLAMKLANKFNAYKFSNFDQLKELINNLMG
jgi:DNA processing protein